MRYLFLLLCFFAMVSCSSFEQKDLIGKWEGEGLRIELNEDKTCTFFAGISEVKGTYKQFFNTLELIDENNKVMFNMRLKDVQADQLSINIQSLGGDNIKVLKRVK